MYIYAVYHYVHKRLDMYTQFLIHDLCQTTRYANTLYPKKYAHGFVVLCFVVVMQSFIMNSHELFIHIHQGCFAGTGAIVRLPQYQWSKPDGYGKISQYITTTKHSKAKTVCIFLGIYCTREMSYDIAIPSITYCDPLVKFLEIPTAIPRDSWNSYRDEYFQQWRHISVMTSQNTGISTVS